MTPERSFAGLKEVRKKLKETWRWQHKSYTFTRQKTLLENVYDHQAAVRKKGIFYLDKYSILIAKSTTDRYGIYRPLFRHLANHHDDHEIMGMDIAVNDQKNHEKKLHSDHDRREMTALIVEHHLPAIMLPGFDLFETAKNPPNYEISGLATALYTLAFDGYDGAFTYAFGQYLLSKEELTDTLAKWDAQNLTQRIIRPLMNLQTMYQQIDNKPRELAIDALGSDLINDVLFNYGPQAEKIKEALIPYLGDIWAGKDN